MKEKMSKKGYVQGDMAPDVKNFQKPDATFPESGFSRTTEYIERQDAFQNKMSSEIKKQHYKGRYS